VSNHEQASVYLSENPPLIQVAVSSQDQQVPSKITTTSSSNLKTQSLSALSDMS
jgi:hypothetical protein